mmetsp:Transcript_6447/g.15658  ORF Transcript_6447/g.15658 Transcript_6447/m.15658 type:complete len:582 (-) Transcript_6447:24-1769(-)
MQIGLSSSVQPHGLMSESEAAFRIQTSYRSHRKDRLRGRHASITQAHAASLPYAGEVEVDDLTPREADRYSIHSASNAADARQGDSRLTWDGLDGDVHSARSPSVKEDQALDSRKASSGGVSADSSPGLWIWRGVFRKLRASADDLATPNKMNAQFESYKAELELRPTRCPKRLQPWRITLFLLIEEPRSSLAAQALSVVMLCFIIISVASFILETMPELRHVPAENWLRIEVVCNSVFTVEYITRLCVCGVAGQSVMSFVTAPMNVCDLCAIMPFYLNLAISRLSWARALGVIRTVRLVRLFRIFKLGRYSSGLQLMGEAIRNSAQALWVLGFFLAVGVLLFSSAIYHVEKFGCPRQDELAKELAPYCVEGGGCTKLDDYREQCRSQASTGMTEYGLCCDDAETPLDFCSILEAFWWVLVTMTTVGYGDAYPRTVLGRVVGTVTMLSGILLIALPVAVIGRKFQEAYERNLDRQAGRAPRGFEREDNHGAHVGGVNYAEMGRRLRMMKVPDAAFGQDATKLAEDLDELANVQTEIIALQSFESAKRTEVLEEFESILAELVTQSGAKTSLKRPATSQGFS